MKNKQFLLLIVAVFLTANCARLTFADTSNNPKNLAVQAVSDNPKEAEIAVKELRELGEKGLQTLFETYTADIEVFKKTGEQTERWQRIAKALDTVAMQKDVYASKLFWNTDLEKAKAESKRTNKPILSLRLLGNLNEEFSCANSRFFRAILYSNRQISDHLREEFVLHWQSVRPAPKITIDFGDGRKIERTITGNSIHYILDPNGNVMDALTGLNSPQIFLEFLYKGGNLAKIMVNYSKYPEHATKTLNTFWADNYRGLVGQLNWFGQELNLQFDTNKKPVRNFEEMPSAFLAMNTAVTKSRIEMPVLKGFVTDITKYGEEQVNFENWKQIVKLSNISANFDQNTIEFIRRQTAKNNLSTQEFTSLINKLQEFVSVDSARNQYLLRPTIMVWLAKGEDKDVSKLNEKVYNELFLTPSADKWLGLYSPDIYTALDGNGVK